MTSVFVIKLLFLPIDTQTPSTPSVRADSSSRRDKKKKLHPGPAVTNLRDSHTWRAPEASYQAHTVHSCMWRPGRIPSRAPKASYQARTVYSCACGVLAVFVNHGGRILGIVKVASLHLPSILNLCPLHVNNHLYIFHS